MGYVIDYAPKKSRPRRTGVWVLAVLALTLLLLGRGMQHFWPEGSAALRQALVPGDAALTEQAVQTLLEQISNGEPAGDAVAAFCREIVQNAQAQP